MITGSVAEAIRDLHARYSDAVWRKDYIAFGECFTHDAEWRIGGMSPRGRADMTTMIERILHNFRRVFIASNPRSLRSRRTRSAAALT